MTRFQPYIGGNLSRNVRDKVREEFYRGGKPLGRWVTSMMNEAGENETLLGGHRLSSHEETTQKIKVSRTNLQNLVAKAHYVLLALLAAHLFLWMRTVRPCSVCYVTLLPDSFSVDTEQCRQTTVERGTCCED